MKIKTVIVTISVATLFFTCAKLEAPLSVASEGGEYFVMISWKVTEDVNLEEFEEFHLYRGETDTKMSKYVSVIPSQNSYLDTSIVPGRDYYYKMLSVSRRGKESEFSNTVKGKGVKYLPLSIQASDSEFGVNISWQVDSESGIAGIEAFKLLRGESNFPLTTETSLVETVNDPEKTSHFDHNIEVGINYFYQVVAVTSTGRESEPSQPVEGKGYLPVGITETEILIGNIQDLSGPMKELGMALPHGSNLYFNYINGKGGIHGRKIKMLIEDHQYNPQRAVAMAKKLVDRDQVFCFYQVIGTSPCEALRPTLEEYKIPLIAPATQSGTMSDRSRRGWEYIFHTDTGYDKQANILVDYA